MDGDGNVYVALNLPGEIVRIAPTGQVSLLTDEVPWAASLAFGSPHGWDRCSLYVTALFSSELYRVGVGVPGLVAGE